MPADEDHLLTERSGGVLTITLNRPDSLNSLTTALMVDFAHLLDGAERDPDVRCIVLTGAGKAFCSGAVNSAGAASFFVAEDMRDAYNPVARKLLEISTPTVAGLKGSAVGAGASLAILCDFRIAADDLKLAFLFVRVGLGLDMGASYRLPRIVGAARAAELAMFGHTLSAEQSAELGLVTRVVPRADLESETAAFAHQLADGPMALGLIKRQLEAAWSNAPDAQLELELRTQTRAAASRDFAEGMTASIERRRPQFVGR